MSTEPSQDGFQMKSHLDWKETEIGKVTTLQRGFDLASRYRKSGSVPIVTSSGVSDFHDTAKVQGPGVVTGRYGTIGQTFFVEGEYWPLNTTLFVSDFHGNDEKFCYYLLKTIDFASHSGKSGVPGINRNDIHALLISAPTEVPEQQAIAKALGDVDGLIASLEALIAKKRDIKLGAMQELLSGHCRLPGFARSQKLAATELGKLPSDWSVADLREINEKVGSGITPTGGSKVYTLSGRPFVRSQNVGWGVLLLDDMSFISDDIHATFDGTEIHYGDVLLNITGASIGRCTIADARVAGGNVNQHVCIIRPKSASISSEFLAHFLLSRSGQRQIESFQAGGNRQGLNFEQVRSVKLPLPSFHEQQAIAQLISDMDAEIATLEAKLAKTRDVKQGMMQVLLTGEVRLI